MKTVCNKGHWSKYYGFIDSQGVQRCRHCRYTISQDKKYWRLVEAYTLNPSDELLKALTEFWVEP